MSRPRIVSAGAGPAGCPTAPTAQHARWRGKVCARIAAASPGLGERHAHRCHGLVGLGGAKAAANPFGVIPPGPAAGTRGHHLAAMPGNRVTSPPAPSSAPAPRPAPREAPPTAAPRAPLATEQQKETHEYR